MKRYIVAWETCFCEDFPEAQGEYITNAENESEVAKDFHIFHAVIKSITEIKGGNVNV